MTNFSLKSPTDKEKINRNCVIILGALYFIALVWIIVFKCNINSLLFVELGREKTVLERLIFAFTLTPFSDLIHSTGIKHYVEVCALIFNVIGFIPLGMVYRFFFKKSRAFLLSFETALGIEIFQLLSCYGGLKPEDIIEYTLGAFLGIVLFEKIIPKISPETINNIARILIYTAIPFDLFFIINTVIHFPG